MIRISTSPFSARSSVLELAAAIAHLTGRDAHLVRLEDATIPLLDALFHDGVVAYEGAPGAAAAWRARTLAALDLDRPWYALQRDAWLVRVAEQGL